MVARARREHDDDFKEMELWEHLAELRSRLIRSVAYIALGMVVGWIFYGPLLNFIMRPIQSIIERYHWKFVFRHITEGFMMQLETALIAGLVIALPLITLEMWGFVAPGLTRNEKKGFYLAVPLSLFFFFLGLTVAYLILPAAFGYFAGFFVIGSQNIELQQNPATYILFVVKMLVAFGVVFQLPVVLMFLGYVGIVSSSMLKSNWRIALVGCSVIAACATPSNDAPTMLAMAVPLCLLYLASIYLVAFVERLRTRHSYRASYDTT